jgi:signal transduction histidine kinase
MNINNRQDQMYLKKLKVLYVEDDRETREQFREFLCRPLGTLITAVDGEEGLELFRIHKPDIVVTDILMPRMDGLTMAHEIRGIAPHVPIVVITAFEQSDYLLRAINIGIDKYVTKPVNSYLLFECLLECAHRLRAEEQLNLERKREIQNIRMKYHESVAIMAGGMAHDYNNLLQSILGYTSLAKACVNPDSECYSHLENVDKSYVEAHKLGERLKILSESGREYMCNGAVLPLFQQIISTALRGTPIKLVSDCPDETAPVNFIENHIRLVFSNLVTNALEAMSSGGTLRLSALTSVVDELDTIPLEPGPYLHIMLSDSGPGIPAENLPNIFDPYFSTKQRCNISGMGLSLALCQTIIINHGGLITVESIEGSGTVFHIWLPTSAE